MNGPRIRYRIMIALVLLSLAACGEAQSSATAQPQATATAQPQATLLGKWRVASVSQAGRMETPAGSEAKIIFEFTQDGSLLLSESGSSEEPKKGNYTLGDDGQLTLIFNDHYSIQGLAEINDERFVLAYDEARPLSRLRQVNQEGTPINPQGTPVAEPPPIMDHMVMTFERVR